MGRRSAAAAVLSQERTPPHNLEIERAVLGALLRAAISGDGEMLDRAIARLRVESFYHGFHRNLYQAIHALRGDGRIPDAIMCADWLKQRGLWDATGGIENYLPDPGNSYMGLVLATEFNIGTLDDYLEILIRDEAKRVMAELGGELWNAALNGHEADELIALTERMIAGVREIHSSSRTLGEGPRMNRMSGADLVADTALVDVAWLPFLRLEGIVGRGIVTLVSSHGKAGKTTALLHAARQLLPRRVLWVTEEPRSLWRTRLRRFPELAAVDLTLIFASGRLWPEVLADLSREEVDLVLVDTIRAVCGILDENDQAAMTAAIQPLIFLARRKNWALILVHHLRKSAADVGLGHAGSHALVGLVDVAVEMHRDSHAPTRRICKTVSRFDDTPAEWVLELHDDEMQVLGDPRFLAAAETMRRVHAVLDEVPRTRAEISALLEPAPSTGALHHALATLFQEGQATRAGRGTKGDPHRWTNPQTHSFIHDLSPIRERMKSLPKESPDG